MSKNQRPWNLMNWVKNRNYPPSKHYVLMINLVLNLMNFDKFFINYLIQPKIAKSISMF